MAPNCSGNVVKIRSFGDVEALNSLQYIRASNNIYFSDWRNAERTRAEALIYVDLRRTAWNRINFMVTEKEEAHGTLYRRATEGDLEGGREFLAINSAMFPEPQNWFSELKWHPKPRVYKTNSGAGILRPTSAAVERYLSGNRGASESS
jgi:hypothetical protein